MKKLIKEIYNQHKTLVVFTIISLIILIMFIIFQYCKFSGLELDVKWIIVSGIPLLIGLFVTGYIKTFKGFGIELEASLKAEVPTNLISPIRDGSIVDRVSLDKESLYLIQNLDNEQKLKISRIRFVLNKRGYYDSYVVTQYFQSLRNLKYVEIVNSNNEFQFLIPIGYFKIHGDIDRNKIDDFIMHIQNETLNATFPGAVSDHVKYDDSLLKAYRKLIRSNNKIVAIGDKKLPVLDANLRVIGLLSKTKVEEFISKEVVENYEEKKPK